MSTAISIIIPTRNRPESLARVFAALESQVNKRLHAIHVVNDGDVSIEHICKNSVLAECIVQHKSECVGPVQARNLALKYIDTPLIAFLDDDSFPEPGWFDACLAMFDHFPEVQAQLGKILWAREDVENRAMYRFVPQLRQKLYDTRHALFTSPSFALHLRNCGIHVPLGLPGIATHLSGGNAAIRAKFLKSHGNFDERYFTYHDRELACRLLSVGNCILYNPNMIVRHDHDPSIQRALRRSVITVRYRRFLEKQYGNEPWWGAEYIGNPEKRKRFLSTSEQLTIFEIMFMTLMSMLQRITETYFFFVEFIKPVSRSVE